MNRASVLTRRFVLPPALIALVWFFFERSAPFIHVLKPIALYLAVSVPAFWLLNRATRTAR